MRSGDKPPAGDLLNGTWRTSATICSVASGAVLVAGSRHDRAPTTTNNLK